MSQSPAATAAAAKTKVKKGSGVAKKGKAGSGKQKAKSTGPVLPTKPNMRKFNWAAGNTTLAKSVQLMGNDLYVEFLKDYSSKADNYRRAARGKKVLAAHAKAAVEANGHFHLIGAR